MRLAPSLSAGRLAISGLGALIFVAAIGWWWSTFEEVVRFGYLSWVDAGRCLISDNDICSLARTLCLQSHPRIFYAYWTPIFWAGVALLSAACLLRDSGAIRHEA